MNFIEKISYDERQKKKLQKYLSKKKKYSNMDKDELEMNYITILSKYEHRKTVLAVFVCTIFVSIVTDVWKIFFEIIGKLLYFMYNNTGTFDIKTAFILMLVIASAIFISLFAVMIGFINDLKSTRQEKIFIERIISKHND